MGDVLDERKYDGHVESHYVVSSAGTARLVEHILQLKVEVRRLRALPNRWMTDDEEADRERLRQWLAAYEADTHFQSLTRKAMAALDRLCPPKAPLTDEELVDILANAHPQGGQVQRVIDALRARKEQK
jgi:hypothetical protein